MLARLNALVRDVTAMLERYDIHGPARAIEGFVDDLSNWYVRRNRRRFWKSEADADQQAAFSTLYTCLTTLSRLLAPFTPYLAESLYRNLVAGQDETAPPSVHLAPWPEADPGAIDEELLRTTARLLETVGLGRSARRTAGLRVRQPLSEVVVRAPEGAGALSRMEDELREELNVKAVRFLDVGEGLVVQRFKPNLPVVGRKLGRLVPALRQALEALSGPEAERAAEAVRQGHPFQLMVGDQTVTLAPEDVLLEASSPPGYAVAEQDGLLVALDTRLTPELLLEGQARDLVRFVQEARRGAGFSISDRISLTIQPPTGLDLEPLLGTFGDYLRRETLAESLTVGPTHPQAHVAQAEIEGQPVILGLERSPVPAA